MLRNLVESVSIETWQSLGAVGTVATAIAAWRSVLIVRQTRQDEFLPVLQPLDTGAKLYKATPSLLLHVRNVGKGMAKDVYVLYDSKVLEGNFSVAVGHRWEYPVPAKDKADAIDSMWQASGGVWWELTYKDIYERLFKTCFFLNRGKDANGVDFFSVDRGRWHFCRQ